MDFQPFWKRKGRRRSILQEWFGLLPDPKNALFEELRRDWDALRWMSAAALDESLQLCHAGNFACARSQAYNSAELLGRLAASKVAACHALRNQGRQFGDLPDVNPLNPDDYITGHAHNSALMSQILYRAVFTRRSRLFYKLDTLSSLIEDLSGEYNQVAAEMQLNSMGGPEASLALLALLEHDINSCFAESQVVFKSFLWALPPDQIPALRRNLDPAWLTMHRKFAAKPIFPAR
ncbi:MAG: hypothetical protein ACRD50_07675 [Candidatus Acidiferrales bacterium]